ncbi:MULTISPECIES: TonB-dependent receptor [unclassified Sphingobium]|uniref:TonB-dependent receptor n=1 Tax=unclassified Sphingobium TaxID=2611147 RepID=UPI002223F46D|nr:MULTISPECIES: TonB-dependent receptor [unclassified Sphingobium]MCW2413598.1 outer membrane receptor for ferrienterochelin and colicin [Sphingobium sp. B8D3D]MCW2414101.1 outer membrane receptor for ferrienterochelin and colicin [Sphingobium sp. B8D3A]
MRNFRFFLAASAASIATCVALSPAHAQETTSSVRGTVTAEGAPVSGAAVTVTHVPSGTVSRTTTGADGSFSTSGLRIGGPYTVEVAASGFEDVRVTDVYTVVGQSFTLPIEMASGDAIVVTASAIRGAGNVSQGPAMVMTAEQIGKIASVNRDIRDIAARDPFATLDTSQTTGRQVSFAGQNPRFNRFTVDGVPVTDSFGLNPDALPSRRGPVPLDSIGQFETKVAPYDIREGFFQGGVSNAILKSGTNEFHGTAFFTFSSDELTGKRTKPYILNTAGRVTQPDFTSKDFGATLSGPIIKDKLFFMVSAERVRAARPVAFGTQEDNAGTPVIGATNAALQQIVGIAQSRYNYDAGGLLRTDGDKDDRIVGKLDANLSETQRVSLTGLYTKDELNVSTTTGTRDLGLESNAYRKPNELKAGILAWNADWSDSFSTETRALYKTYDSGQFPLMGRSAQMSVCAAPTSDRTTNGATTTAASIVCPTGTPQFVLGAGGPSQSNVLNIKSWGGSVSAKLKAGDHNLRALAEWNHTKSFNMFVNPSAGTYYFDSIADFQAGTAQSFSYNNAASLNPADAAASFSYNVYTFGLQDDWRVNETLSVGVGLRWDVFGMKSTAAVNPNFYPRYGFSNNSNISGIDLLQPRLGFTYKATPRLTIRGGGGIFGGGSPDVYIGNSFSNTGVINTSITARQTDGGIYQLNGSASGANSANASSILNNPSFTNIPAAANTAVVAAANGLSANPNATTSINAIDPNFKAPNQFRATLSADYEADLGPLGDGWRFGADVLYSKVRSQVKVIDLRSIPVAGSLTPDGRQRYTSKIGNANDTGQDLLLTNTDYGRGWIGVLRAEKSWDWGLTLGGAYTRQDVRDDTSLTSSQASSIYGNTAAYDANLSGPGHSNDEVTWAFRYNASFERAFFGDYKTRIDLFGSTRAGARYSYTMQDLSGGRSGVFGTAGSAQRYLFYVPTGVNDPKVIYDSAATATRIDSIIQSSGLAGYRGQVAPRNAFRSKAFTRIDLHVEQELPLPLGTRFALFADIENFTNLLNHKWGQQLRSSFPFRKTVAKVSCVAVGANSCAQYKYEQPSSDTVLADELVTTNGSSLYAIRLGARFSF